MIIVLFSNMYKFYNVYRLKIIVSVGWALDTHN